MFSDGTTEYRCGGDVCGRLVADVAGGKEYGCLIVDAKSQPGFAPYPDLHPRDDASEAVGASAVAVWISKNGMSSISSTCMGWEKTMTVEYFQATSGTGSESCATSETAGFHGKALYNVTGGTNDDVVDLYYWHAGGSGRDVWACSTTRVLQTDGTTQAVLTALGAATCAEFEQLCTQAGLGMRYRDRLDPWTP